eukprot:Blabericola_migrator_1__2281@NODE_1630_length_4139_cov_65_354371_g1062_i0_p1_GENE_NODE_1630_length_4139_cov_65_354371_g1062_i0NODE_1630_length_4139_cov_65_354371_g1062_i0_p1_ORF_typecomplete_len825_score121_45Pkinase/PF00069_25/7_3e18Pkinase_Tyr/PF07714_17/1_2e08Kinaselike/PF14531_6/0_0017_NODE_1630_length_4139_cov_65_354371_g1062_i01722646
MHLTRLASCSTASQQPLFTLFNFVWLHKSGQVVTHYSYLQPDNILLSNGHVKVIDFNSAVMVGDGVTSASSYAGLNKSVKTSGESTTRKDTDFGGTLPWWSPERVSLYIARSAQQSRSPSSFFSQGGSVDRFSPDNASRRCPGIEFDLWSLGCVMYEMLVGTNPFLRGTPELTADKIMKYSQRSASIDFPTSVGPLTRNLCLKLLEPNPLKRAEIIPADKTQLLNHPFFTGFNFHSPLSQLDASHLIKTLLQSGNRRDARNGAMMTPSLLEFTPEASGQAFRGRDLNSLRFNNTGQRSEGRSYKRPPFQSPKTIHEATPVEPLPYNGEPSMETRAVMENNPSDDEEKETPKHERVNNDGNDDDSTFRPGDTYNSRDGMSSNKGDPKSGFSCPGSIIILKSRRMSSLVQQDALLRDAFRLSPMEPATVSRQSLPYRRRRRTLSEIGRKQARGVTSDLTRLTRSSTPQEVVEREHSVPLVLDSSPSSPDHLSRRPDTSAQQVDATLRFSQVDRQQSVRFDPIEHIHEEEPASAESEVPEWVEAMRSESFKDFVIDEIVKELKVLVTSSRTYDPDVEVVSAAEIMTWGPVLVSFTTQSDYPLVETEDAPVLKPSVASRVITEAELPNVSPRSSSREMEAMRLSRCTVQRSSVGGAGNQPLCCVRSPSYYVLNRLRRWLTPVNTPYEGSEEDMTIPLEQPQYKNPPEYKVPQSHDIRPQGAVMTSPGHPCFGMLSGCFGLMLFEANLADNYCCLADVLPVDGSASISQVNSTTIEIKMGPAYVPPKYPNVTLKFRRPHDRILSIRLDCGTVDQLEDWLPHWAALTAKA